MSSDRAHARPRLLDQLASLAYVMSWAGALSLYVWACYMPDNDRAWLSPPRDWEIRFYTIYALSPAGAFLGALLMLTLRRAPRPIRALRKASAATIVGIVAACTVPMAKDELLSPSTVTPGMICLNNVKQLSFGLLMYAEDYDDHLPDGTAWVDAQRPYTRDARILVCPAAEKDMPSYALCGRLVGVAVRDVREPASVVLMFESPCGPCPVGGPELLLSPPRHNEYGTIGFLDGHAKLLSPAEARSTLRWKP